MKRSKTIYPLRKIERLIEHLSRSGFMSTMKVHLECGHDVVVSTATTYRARCYHCPPKTNDTKGVLPSVSETKGK